MQVDEITRDRQANCEKHKKAAPAWIPSGEQGMSHVVTWQCAFCGLAKSDYDATC